MISGHLDYNSSSGDYTVSVRKILSFDIIASPPFNGAVLEYHNENGFTHLILIF